MSLDRSQPLVSIIIPSYNQAAYLEHAIRSVLSQDYSPIEVILVDGGSTDGSLEVIQKYAARLDWWVSEPDHGQADAINKGFKRARGEIVAWLNSDDLYLPGAVSAAVGTLQADPEAGLVYGDAITIDAQGCPLKVLRFSDWGLEQFIGFRIICQPAVFMRHAALEQAGWLDTSYHYMLDHHLWVRIAQNSRVRHIPQVWAAARHHPGAKNVARPLEFGREISRMLSWMQTDSDLAPRIDRSRLQVRAGAYRLTARYLLDGGMYKDALKAYWKAALARPDYALRHWHRMLFALVGLVGMGNLSSWYYRLRRARPLELENEPVLSDWPGLCFHQPRP